MAELRAPKGATHKKRIIGRGIGSNRGGTSGKGNKGQNARSGGGVRPGFEGGQMPLFRRIARRGFSNYRSKKHFQIINIGEVSKRFDSGGTVDEKSLLEKRLIKGNGIPTKLLGMGYVDKKLEVKIEHVSKSAREKIEKAGGSVSDRTAVSKQVVKKAIQPKAGQKRPAPAEPESESEEDATESAPSKETEE